MAKIRISLRGVTIAEAPLESGKNIVIGRAENCDVILPERPGLSRQHVEISDKSGSWQAKCVARFGHLLHEGERVASVELEHGSTFEFADFIASANFDAEAEPRAETSSSEESSLPGADHSLNPLTTVGLEDETRVSAGKTLKPFLIVHRPGFSEEEHELRSSLSIVGREDRCDVVIADRKISRKQFSIEGKKDGFRVTDLGSANGTLLNGTQMLPHEPMGFASGDVLEVQGIVIRFELRDAGFDKRARDGGVSGGDSPGRVNMLPYEMINYPVMEGPGGAVRLGGSLSAGTEKKDAGKQTLAIRYGLMGLVAVIGLYAVLGPNTPETPKKGTSKLSPTEEAFRLLTPAQQQMVKELYQLGIQHFLAGNFESALAEFDKLHLVLKEGYKDSLARSEQCRAHRSQQQQLQAVLMEKERLEEQNRMIEQNIAECEPVAKRTFDLITIQNCLAVTLGFDPTNARAATLIEYVKQRVEEKEKADRELAEFKKKVGEGKALYDEAMNLKKKSSWYPAMDAFQTHIDSEWPDPNGLKKKSKREVQSIKYMLDRKVKEMLVVAEASYGSKNFKEAIESARKAREFDPYSMRAASFIGKVRKELNTKLKPVYEDAIVEESVGQIEGAKSKWRQILELDTDDGEYAEKAKLRLRNYSN